MPKNITQYELLISCPGDVKDEIEIISKMVQKFNSELGGYLGIVIQERHWTKDSYPSSGDKPQNILNKQFVNDCDAAVAIFWTRFGTPTDEYGSGTEEEIEKMIADKKQVFMYFSDAPVKPSQTDMEQYEKIQQFKERYKNKGLYCSYNNPEEFGNLFYAHLTKYFISLSAVEEVESAKKPDLKIELLDAETIEPIKEVYKFKYPIGLITRKELSEDDIFDEIEQYVTIDDINEYNAALPSVEEVDDFNTQKRLYENAQNNCYGFKLSIVNDGKAKAKDIYVDLYFPEEILVYYEDDIEDIKEPRDKLEMPENPVWKAIDKIEQKKMRAIMGKSYEAATNMLLKQQQIIDRYRFITPDVYPPTVNMVKLLNPKRFDYGIDSHKKLSMHIDSLLHTREYISDEFSLIFTSQGEFEMQYSIMCEEWEEAIEGQFKVNVER